MSFNIHPITYLKMIEYFEDVRLIMDMWRRTGYRTDLDVFQDIYYMVNFYPDGTRVEDAYGNVLEPISIERIKEIIMSY